MSFIFKNIFKNDECQYLTDKKLVNWETPMNSLSDLVDKEHLIQLLGTNTSFKELKVLYHTEMRGKITHRKTVAEDIAEIKIKKRIEKKLLHQILDILDDNISLYELRRIYSRNIMNIRLENMEKRYQIKRKNMLKELKIDEFSMISDDELTNLYEDKLKIIDRINKEHEEFYKKYCESKGIKTTLDDYKIEDNNYKIEDNNYEYKQGSDSILHNSGGAIIYTSSNAMDVMTFNEESGIYEQF
jgi:hypothetical protein